MGSVNTDHSRIASQFSTLWERVGLCLQETGTRYDLFYETANHMIWPPGEAKKSLTADMSVTLFGPLMTRLLLRCGFFGLGFVRSMMQTHGFFYTGTLPECYRQAVTDTWTVTPLDGLLCVSCVRAQP